MLDVKLEPKDNIHAGFVCLRCEAPEIRASPRRYHQGELRFFCNSHLLSLTYLLYHLLPLTPSLQLRLSPTFHSEPLNPHLPPLTCNLSSHLSHPLYFLISPHLTPHTHTSHLSTLTSPLTLTSHYLLTPHHCTHPTTLLHLSLITSHPHLSSPLLISPTPLLTL